MRRAGQIGQLTLTGAVLCAELSVKNGTGKFFNSVHWNAGSRK